MFLEKKITKYDLGSQSMEYSVDVNGINYINNHQYVYCTCSQRILVVVESEFLNQGEFCSLNSCIYIWDESILMGFMFVDISSHLSIHWF